MFKLKHHKLLVPVEEKQTYMDKIEREQMDSSMKFPATNYFEDMINWTKEKKMWTFPINNEEGNSV